MDVQTRIKGFSAHYQQDCARDHRSVKMVEVEVEGSAGLYHGGQCWHGGSEFARVEGSF